MQKSTENPGVAAIQVNEQSSEPINNEENNENSIIARQYKRLFNQVVGDDCDANSDCEGDSDSDADPD